MTDRKDLPTLKLSGGCSGMHLSLCAYPVAGHSISWGVSTSDGRPAETGKGLLSFIPLSPNVYLLHFLTLFCLKGERDADFLMDSASQRACTAAAGARRSPAETGH